MENNFEVLHTLRFGEVKELRDAFLKKKELEKEIAVLIRQYEDETGVAVDLVKYQRDLTLPTKRKAYITLHIKLSNEELEKW
jgi:hypothetical protein